MRKKLGLIIVILFTLTVTPLSLVFAQEDMSNNSDGTTEQSDGNYEIQETKETEYEAGSKERMTARKEALKETPTKTQQKRLATRCAAAQKTIEKVSEKAKEARTNRDDIYSNVLKSATKLRDRLKENDKDTTKLDADLKELETLIAKFKTDMKELRQAAYDISNMKCADDPVGFKATLEAFRTARTAVHSDSEAIRMYIKDNLKPTLQEIRNSIGEAKKEETN